MISDIKKEAIKTAVESGPDALLEVFLYSARIKDWDAVIYMAQEHYGDFWLINRQAVTLIGEMADQLKAAAQRPRSADAA